MLLGTTDNMRHAGEVIQRKLARLGVDISLVYEPFDGYSEYLFSGLPDSFGLTIGEAPRPPGGTLFLELEDLPIASELYLRAATMAVLSGRSTASTTLA